MIPYTCPCCEVSHPPHRDGCTLHNDCPTDAEVFDEVSSLRAEIDRLREERRWIPVTERLPDRHERVIVAMTPDSRGLVEVCEATLNYYGTRFQTDYGAYECSHWQPLPAPPSEGEVE